MLDCKDPLIGRADRRVGHSPGDGEIEPMTDTAVHPTGEQYNPRIVPDTDEAKRVSAVAEELYKRRQAACLALNLGLTKIYNYIKGKTEITDLATDHQTLIIELRELHDQLNNAVCACYRWPEDTWRDENEVLKRLLELNLALTG